MVLWCLSTGFSQVFTATLEQNIHPVVVCFFSFLITAVIFVALNVKNMAPLMEKSKQHMGDVIKLNITTLGCWVVLLYPFKYMEPSIIGALIMGIYPVATVFLGRWLYRQQSVTKKDYFFAFLLMLMVIYLAYICVDDKSALLLQPSKMQIALSLAISIFASIMLGANTIYTKRLSVAHFSPFDILSVRFFLLLLVTGGFLVMERVPVAFSYTFSVDMLILAFSLLVIPQFFFQLAVNKLEPISIAIICPLMPVIAFFLEYADKRLNPTGWTMAGLIGIFFVSLFGAVSRYRKEQTQ